MKTVSATTVEVGHHLDRALSGELIDRRRGRVDCLTQASAFLGSYKQCYGLTSAPKHSDPGRPAEVGILPSW